MPKSWPNPKYEVRVTFDAPVEFVYRWCTDYTPQDARYEKDEYQRRILRRSPREVVYEDLSESKDGWFWSRHVVRLSPPNHWHSDTVGSHREYSLDYRLARLPGNRTRLTLKARRRPYGIGGKNPAKGPWEVSVAKSWRNFRRVLERDYQKARPKTS
ncbi:MAG: hypothetical protein WB809_00350 [Thermoplasmata archaeon]